MSLTWCKYWFVSRSCFRTMPSPLPITQRPAVRLSADVDRATADRVDRLAARYRVKRAEIVRAMVRQALEQQQA